ncbi:MAG: 4-hydroxy-3-methylbut-2-enyl diphosphate reductase [Rikenellaceae bacterium]
MKIDIDKGSGFCFGVVTAISKAEQALEHEPLYSLGDIVHNRVEVQRLEGLGLDTITLEQLPLLSGKTVLIRAHGEPPTTYALAEQHGVVIVDATCPVVAKLQKMVLGAFKTMSECNGQVVLLGKRGHAEVVGLTGQVESGKINVIENAAELESIDFARPIYFLAQTTQSLDLFNSLGEQILARAIDKDSVTIHDTICRQVSNRSPHLQQFSQSYDCIIFVCGKKSSNGKVLFETCLKANSKTYNIEDKGELQPEWFDGVQSVGICGATSTPTWLMEQVAQRVKEITENK